MRKLLAILLISIIACHIIEKPKPNIREGIWSLCWHTLHREQERKEFLDKLNKVRLTKIKSGNAAAVAFCKQIQVMSTCELLVNAL